MKKKQSTDLILGVMVTERKLHAALLKTSSGGEEVLRRFTRQRSAGPAEPAGEMGAGLPDAHAEDDDFTLQIGESSGGADQMFLSSEFGEMDSEAAFSGDRPSSPEAAAFVLELQDILDECRNAGYEDPTVVFCNGASNVEQYQVYVAEDEAEGIRKKKLYNLLSEQHQVGVSKEEVTFLPMTPSENGSVRYLALHAKAAEPVRETLKMMREDHYDLPQIRFLDTEASLYAGVARRDFAAPGQPADETFDEVEQGYTLVVRTGVEDTLVTFLRDGRLHHCENLRSLTTFDAPETICSRVLLIQDEYGIGDVERVLLIGEDQEVALIESFESFFPGARVVSMQDVLPGGNTVDEDVGLSTAAVGVATRLLDEERGASTFEEVNLLPESLLRRRIKLPVSGQSVAALAVLFCTVLFFIWRFFSMQGEISEARHELQRLRSNPVEQDPQVVQARIDTLKTASKDLIKALGILDELLVGSDQWSRALEKTSREVASVNHIWVDSWTPQGSSLTLQGNTTARSRVVNLAERTNGAIESLTFSEIREWPVYSFTLEVPLEKELPQAARYLRQRLAARDSADDEGVPTTSASLNE